MAVQVIAKSSRVGNQRFNFTEADDFHVDDNGLNITQNGKRLAIYANGEWLMAGISKEPS